jgi:hypothetical protein
MQQCILTFSARTNPCFERVAAMAREFAPPEPDSALASFGLPCPIRRETSKSSSQGMPTLFRWFYQKTQKRGKGTFLQEKQ